MSSSTHSSGRVSSHLQGKVRDMESAWTMFSASTADAVSKSCGQKVVGATSGSSGYRHGGHQAEEGGLLDSVVLGVT